MKSIAKVVVVCAWGYCSLANALLVPEHEKGEGIWQLSGLGLYADQSNNLPLLIGSPSIGGGGGGGGHSITGNPFRTLGEHITPDPEERWGFGGSIGYILPSHKYDIQVSYLNISADANPHGTLSGLYPLANGETFGYDADEEFNFNAFDILFGRYFEIDLLELRTSAGVTFANIDQKDHAYLIGIANSSTGGPNGDANVHLRNRFIGAGPKIQLDAALPIYYDSLGIIGGIGLGVLLGNAKAEADIVQTDAVPTFSDTYNNGENKVAVAVDAKAGFLYVPSFGEDMSGMIEIGYQFDAYLNAMQDAEIQQATGGGAVEFDTNGDYTYSGPYIELGLNF